MKLFFASIAIASLCACGGQTIGDLDAGGTDSGGVDTGITPKDSGGTGTCSANTPCTNGTACGYDESQGCAAKTGQCFPLGAVCNTFQPGCSCNNQTINIACTGLPDGYSTAPLSHTGSCGTTTLDAGSSD